MTPIEPSSAKPADVSLSQDSLFSQRANSAWGIAFVTTEAVSTATDAVADGFAELFQEVEGGSEPQDTRFEALRLTRAAAVRLLQAGPGGRHSREPVSILGETKDRQATLALTALTEPSRSVLWLIEAERLSVEQTAVIMDTPSETVSAVIRRARSDFRRYYVDATKRDGLNAGCVDTLDLLASYSSQSLNAGERSSVENHLATCDSCRNIVAKLNDLESRLHAAIPAIPAWTRQYVMDTWEAISTHETVTGLHAKEPSKNTNMVRRLATAVAGVAIISATVIGLTYPAKEDIEPRETTSSQLAAPPEAGEPGGGNPTDDNEPSVATPSFSATTEQPAVTADDAVSETADAQSSTQAVATHTTVREVETVEATTTTVPKVESTTTTTPDSEDENVLVDLPPVPASTTTTTTARQSNGRNR
jgi:DNA-directed RNA polymerase specialized sigma24 family protein